MKKLKPKGCPGSQDMSIYNQMIASGNWLQKKKGFQDLRFMIFATECEDENIKSEPQT